MQELKYLGFAETEVRRDLRGTFSAGTELQDKVELRGLKIVQPTPSKTFDFSFARLTTCTVSKWDTAVAAVSRSLAAFFR